MTPIPHEISDSGKDHLRRLKSLGKIVLEDKMYTCCQEKIRLLMERSTGPQINCVIQVSITSCYDVKTKLTASPTKYSFAKCFL